MKKHFFAFIAFVQITLLFVPIFSVQAFLIGGGSVNVRGQIKSFLHDDLLIDDNDLGIGQNDQKTLVPEVKITLTKIDDTHYKATAQAQGVTNPNEAYYTWYIRNKKDKHLRGFNPAGTLPLADQIGSAGADPDDPEFWKIMATRELIKYYFDPMRYDSTFNGGNGDFILSDGEYASNKDRDGYKAIVGGGNANNGAKYCYLYDRESGEVYEMASGGSGNSGVECPLGFTASCIADQRSICPDPADSSRNVLYDFCTEKSKPVCTNGMAVTPTCSHGGTPACVKSDYNASGVCPKADEPLPKSCNDLTMDGTVSLSSISCSSDMTFSASSACDEDGIHLFPFSKGNSFAGYNFVSGDGSFGDDEERFWGTNPENDSTVPDHLDEDTVVGKGMATFIWEYHEGDEIGVVIEGTGNPTRHDDRSTQTVFAFLPGGCKPLDTGSYIEDVRGKGIEIFTTDMDRDNLNDCIAQDDNFVSPGGQKEELKLDVKIIGPDSKILPKDKNKLVKFDSVLSHKGDHKNVKTTRDNTDFEWLVEHSYSKDGPFVPITDKTFLKDQFNILNSRGLGLDSFTMSQNFPTTGGTVTSANPNGDWFARSTNLSEGKIKDKGWVRITLRVNAPSARANVTRFGQTSYLFQISDTGDSFLHLSVAKPADATAKSYVEEKPICRGAGEYLDCEVLVNQVIRVALPSSAMTARNTLWKVNGKSVVCNEFISNECKPDNHGVIYVPIVKDVNTYKITATVSELGTVESANNGGGSSKIASTIEYTAVLNKIKPSLTLSAGGSASEFARGTKLNVDGTTVNEISHNLFTADRGSSVTVKANFIPSFLTIGPEAHLEWYINSTPYSTGDVDHVDFSSERDVTVKANGFYDISDEKRLALKNIYGITADVSGRTFFDESVKVEMLDKPVSSKTPSNKIFATISKNSPAYIMFLLKIIFMVGIVLFIPYAIINLNKKSN